MVNDIDRTYLRMIKSNMKLLAVASSYFIVNLNEI